jgi:hypothetical protein
MKYLELGLLVLLNKMEIDFKNPPFNHAGRWHKKYDSLMNPGTKVTWPQLVVEYLIYFRTKFIPTYNDVKIGPDWYKPIQGEVRRLNQQSTAICNYFAHPDDEPLVLAAFKNHFRKHKPMKMGRYIKNRITTKGGKEKLNITQDEKDLVTGINHELKDLLKQREVFKNLEPVVINTDNQDTYRTASSHSLIGKMNIGSLLQLEKTQISSKK